MPSPIAPDIPSKEPGSTPKARTHGARDSARHAPRAIHAGYAALLALALALLFYNLDGHLLWGDEAETAVLARNVLHSGWPKTYDGLNRVTLYGGDVDANQRDVWIWSPWLQEYVAAASFAVFGPTTWAGRAPFALLAWLAVALLGWLAYRIHRHHGVALGAMALFSTSEIFLLHARQCRYYSLAVFTEILLVLGVVQLRAGKRRGMFAVAIALIAQFYTNYIIAAANLPAMALLAFTLGRRRRREALRVPLSLLLVLVAAAPWLLYARPWATQAGGVGSDLSPAKVWYYIREFNFHFLPLVFLLVPAGAALMSRVRGGGDPRSHGTGGRESARLEGWLLFLVVSGLAVVVLAPEEHLRYLLPLLPVACLLAAAWVFRCLRWRAVAVAVIAVQCLSNLFALGPLYPWRGGHALRWPLFRYVGGVTHAYTDRLADVLAFLQREAGPGQSVLVYDPEFPLQFYTRLRIIDARLNGGVFEQRFPDWVFPESASGIPRSSPLTLPDSIKPYYETITLPVHRSGRTGVVPEPDLYEYDSGPVRPFVIYRLRGRPQGEKPASAPEPVPPRTP